MPIPASLPFKAGLPRNMGDELGYVRGRFSEMSLSMGLY